MPALLTHSDWKLVSCADCHRDLLGDSMVHERFKKPDGLQFVGGYIAIPLDDGHVHNRPYCVACLARREAQR